MKKSIAVFFILIANLVILLHAVVPHHHHQIQICIESKHCHCSNNAENENHNNANERHGSNENCILKQVVIIPENTFRQALKGFVFIKNSMPVVDFLSVMANNQFVHFASERILVLKIPLKTVCYTSQVARSFGLRAPPVV